MANVSKQVAVVDDDPSVLRALARLLSSRSFTAEIYNSASEFLASLAYCRPACLIVDFQMPEMTGLELQHELLRRGIQIPTIVITAHEEVGLRERCEFAGAVAFLPKPLHDVRLFAALDMACSISNG